MAASTRRSHFVLIPVSNLGCPPLGDEHSDIIYKDLLINPNIQAYFIIPRFPTLLRLHPYPYFYPHYLPLHNEDLLK
jgi:hypothetical protein